MKKVLVCVFSVFILFLYSLRLFCACFVASLPSMIVCVLLLFGCVHFWLKQKQMLSSGERSVPMSVLVQEARRLIQPQRTKRKQKRRKGTTTVPITNSVALFDNAWPSRIHDLFRVLHRQTARVNSHIPSLSHIRPAYTPSPATRTHVDTDSTLAHSKNLRHTCAGSAPFRDVTCARTTASLGQPIKRGVQLTDPPCLTDLHMDSGQMAQCTHACTLTQHSCLWTEKVTVSSKICEWRHTNSLTSRSTHQS